MYETMLQMPNKTTSMNLGGCIVSSIYIIIINIHQTANEDGDFDAEEGRAEVDV